MKDGTSKTGFMPRRIRFNSAPSSYGLRPLTENSKLELEKIWEAKAQEADGNILPVPENRIEIRDIKKAA